MGRDGRRRTASSSEEARLGIFIGGLSIVPAKAIALVEAADAAAVLARAAQLGWGVRYYGGKIGCLLPQQVSLEEVVHALSGIGASSVSLQPVSLEHAYLEVMDGALQPPSAAAGALARELEALTT